jgi:hypothetical protein
MNRARSAVVVIVAAVALIAAAPPCLACSCIASSDAEHFARADVVFTGRAVERHDPNAGNPVQNSADPVHWTFDVEARQKGTTDDPQLVTTPREEASCGFTFTTGKRYQVFARTLEDGSLETNLCDGTRELSAGQGGYAPPARTPAPTLVPPPPPSPTTGLSTPEATPQPSTTPTPTITPVASPVAEEPDLARTSGDDTSAAPAVAVLLGAVGALAVAVGLVRRTSG